MLKYLHYIFDDVGIRKKSATTYTVQWENVVSVSTVLADHHNKGRYYRTNICSDDDEAVVLKCFKQIQISINNHPRLPAYITILEFVLTKVRSRIVGNKTRFIVEWAIKARQAAPIRKQLKANPDNPELIKSLANIYWAQLKSKSARKLFKLALKINPRDTQALESVALIGFELYADHSELIEQYEHIVAIDPSNVEYLRVLTYLYLMHDYPQAINYSERILELKPEEIGIRNRLSEYYFHKENFSKSKEYLEQILSISDDKLLHKAVRNQRSYIDKYEHNENFREEEKRKQKAYIRKLKWVTISAFIAIIGTLLCFTPLFKLLWKLLKKLFH